MSNAEDILDDDFLYDDLEGKKESVFNNINSENLIEQKNKSEKEHKEIEKKKKTHTTIKPMGTKKAPMMFMDKLTEDDELQKIKEEENSVLEKEVKEDIDETEGIDVTVDNQLEIIQDVLGLEFSKEQQAIIKQKGQPLNVLSGAGSGKTTVLVAKMLYRELAFKVNPLNMLAITFSKRATDEMQERYLKARRKIRKKVNLSKRGHPTFKTFHALFKMLLQTLKDYEKVEVLESNKYNLKLSNLVKTGEDVKKTDVLQEMFTFKGWLINQGFSKDGIENAKNYYSDEHGFQLDNYKAVMEKYKDLKAIDNLIDFDDMQTIIYEEVIEHGNEEPVKAYRRVWGEGDIYIDEYQDISPIQREIMDKLIKDFNRMVVIGDDDQSIYSFRGSDPKFIIDFTHNYTFAMRLHLTTNYRCKENILNPVLPSIKNNKNRVKKDIKAHFSGGVVEALPVTTTNQELVDSIKEEVKEFEGDMFQDIAVLVRNNSQRMLLADALIEEGIPVNVVNTKFALQENKVYNTILDIVDMVKEEDNELFKKNAKILFPHIRKEETEKYLLTDKNWYEDVVNSGYYRVSKEQIDLIKKIKATNNMRNAILYAWNLSKKYYSFISSKGYGNFDKTKEIVFHMAEIAKGCSLTDFYDLEDKKFARINLWCNSEEALQINTLHSVKGLEFDIVYLVGLDKDVIPDERRIGHLIKKGKTKQLEQYIEEERRLFYVGWTRAKYKLVISFDSRKPSPFLREIDGSTIEGWKTENEEAEQAEQLTQEDYNKRIQQDVYNKFLEDSTQYMDEFDYKND